MLIIVSIVVNFGFIICYDLHYIINQCSLSLGPSSISPSDFSALRSIPQSPPAPHQFLNLWSISSHIVAMLWRLVAHKERTPFNTYQVQLFASSLLKAGLLDPSFPTMVDAKRQLAFLLFIVRVVRE
ncbi:unnamed protein product [Lactuca virosa]|uniref:Uncharacterized protein n=1 Tax=Lactuca virosa TaxID=75947 RepID=A0AAU9N8J9_9ASTR|nr:unnamed protein product [Lactuca virosa]